MGDAASERPHRLRSGSAHPLFRFPVNGEEKKVDDLEHQLNTNIRKFIRRKANQLAGKYGFHSDETEDIEQSLVLCYLQGARRFDSRRGSIDHFGRCIIKHGVAKLIQSQRAMRRGFGTRLCSFSTSRADTALPDLTDLISESRCVIQHGRAWLNFEEHAVLRLDVAKTIETLPADLRGICQLLMVVDCAAQVATLRGISRATLYRRFKMIRATLTHLRGNRKAESEI